MDLPLLRSSDHFTQRFPTRQGLGLVLAVILLLIGREIRTRMLVDDHGQWRNHLWLDELMVPGVAAAAEGKATRPVLTGPLPINTCSQDSLTLLPGVGTVMAGRIAAARQRGMVFTCGQDLQQIKGIGPKLSSRLDTLLVYTLPISTHRSVIDSLPGGHR